MLKFNSDKNYVIGLDLGATLTKGVLSNLNGKFIEEIEIPTRLDAGFDEIMRDVSELIEKLSKIEMQSSRSRIFGVGIAVAGLVDLNKNVLEYSPNFKWHNVETGDISGIQYFD